MIGNVVLGVTGGIAAYKSAEIVSRLKKRNVNVDVIMTKSAQEFIAPLTFQSLSGNKTVTDMFSTDFRPDIEHISLAKKADVLLIAPATANIIGKLAYGIADDMLSTVAMATKAQLIIAPAMNTVMYESLALQENLATLKKRGAIIIEPKEGLLACNDVGKGKMEEPEVIVDAVMLELIRDNDLRGKKVLVTAGPTRESIDPVRFITNRSTGKMGYAMAQEAVRRGAKVTLITGKTNEKIPYGIAEVIEIESAKQMYEAVMNEIANADIVIKSAAVADYKPKNLADQKLKKSDGEMMIELDRTKDILFEIGKRKKLNQILVGFAAETHDLIAHASAKIQKKNLDLIVANNVKMAGAGFGTDTNIVTLIHKDGELEQLPMMTKQEVAKSVFDRISELIILQSTL